MPAVFSFSRLVLRGVRHYWRINLAVLLACAVGVAVLTGSLLVGDSVRGSLRALVLDRLGGIDQALVSERFLRADLARAFPGAAAAILLDGSVARAQGGARANHVQILGVDESFWRFGARGQGWWKDVGPLEAVVNEALAREIGANEGDDVLVRVQKPSAIPRQTFLGERDQTVATLRLRIARVIPSQGLGRFGLRPSQYQPFNIYVPLSTLQSRLSQEGRINTILTAGSEDLSGALAKAFDLDDAGLALHPNEKQGWLSVESSQVFLPPYLAGVISQCAADLNLTAAPTLAYLVNSMRIGNRAIPYSIVAALNEQAPPDGQILLNAWAAGDLRARAGDPIRLEFFVPGSRGDLRETSMTLTVSGVVPMTDRRVDSGLVPEFPGISDAKTLAGWKAPFPLDVRRIRPADEEYWNQYHATPKGFVSLKTGQALWGNPYGNLTSIRFVVTASGVSSRVLTGGLEGVTKETPKGVTTNSEGVTTNPSPEAVARALRTKIDPAKTGLVFEPVKAQGLAASRGASDFGGLFIGFSLFLLVSAAILIQILFRLGVEGRARQYGLLSAIGLPPRRARALMLGEGAIVAAGGAIAGVALGIGYARLLILGLHTWWIGAIGSAFLDLFVRPSSVIAGLAGGWAVAMLSMWRAVRRLSRVPARALLAGRLSEAGSRSSRGGWSGGAGIGFLIAGVALAAAGPTVSAETQAALFFGAGALLLAASMSFFAAWLRRVQFGIPPSARHGEKWQENQGTGTLFRGTTGGSALDRQAEKRASPRFSCFLRGRIPNCTRLRREAVQAPERLTLTRLGMASARRAPGRSLLVAGLMACATFVIVAVGANRTAAPGRLGKDSGTGGFALLAESSLPLYRPIDPKILEGATAYSLRLKPGDDASCLNLYQAARPRILGVGDDFIRRGGFLFAAAEAKDEPDRANPWRLLDRPLPGGAVPAIGDYNTVVWLLHRGLGKEFAIDGTRFRIVGLLKGSVFQSGLLIGERSFERLYPAESGWRFFAIDALPGQAEALSMRLESALEDFGFDATSAPRKLNELMTVENTYLATFQSLGGLGLLLGTLGLALALARNLLERRGEFALLRAVGYRRSALRWLALSENLFLLLVGLASGAVCALIAVAPASAARAAQTPWLSLGATLLGVFLFGLGATALSAWAVLRSPALQTLKEE